MDNDLQRKHPHADYRADDHLDGKLDRRETASHPGRRAIMTPSGLPVTGHGPDPAPSVRASAARTGRRHPFPKVGVLLSALTLSAMVPFAAISVVAAPPAAADSLGTARAQAADLAQKIAAQQTEVDRLSEQFDGARYQLQQADTRVAADKAALATASAEASSVQSKVVAGVIKAYTGGDFSMMTAGILSPGVNPAIAQSYLNLATSTQQDLLDQLRTTRRMLASRQADLGRVQRQASEALTSLKVTSAAVQSAQAQTKATLAAVTGQIAILVAQQQAQVQAARQAAYQAQQAQQVQQAQLVANRLNAPSAAASAAPASASPASAAPATTVPPGPPSSTGGESGGSTGGSTGGESAAAATAVRVALAQVGKPYQWGAAGPDSFDCSGLVQFAYLAAGIYLPHYTVAQWDGTTHIPLSDLRPGDLIFFFTDFHHVGIYVGNGMMVDAPHTGAFVRVESVDLFGPIAGASRVA